MDRKRKQRFQRILCLMIAVIVAGIQPCYAAENGTKIKDRKARTKQDPAWIEMADGEYAIPVDLEGGSGKASVTSPASLTITDGTAVITLVWSSSNYDYMIVGGERYEPVNEDGYSTFEIPVISFDEPMIVIADTTAMSTPHEIEYTLTLYEDEIVAGSETPQAAARRVVYMAMAIIAVCIVVSFINKKRRGY